MNIVGYIQAHWTDIGTTVALLHLFLGVLGNFGLKVQGLDDVITNIVKAFGFQAPTPPKA